MADVGVEELVEMIRENLMLAKIADPTARQYILCARLLNERRVINEESQFSAETVSGAIRRLVGDNR